MKIYIDNRPVFYPGDSLLKPSLTYRRQDEEGFKAFSLTGDLEFTGDDYSYLKSKLWDDPNALNNEVELKFIDDCCSGLIDPFIFSIQAQSLKWCENSCTLTASAVEKSQESESLKCLRNTFIWDNTASNWSDGIPFKSRVHPRITYCNEIRPSWQHDFIIICGIIFEVTSVTFWPIIIMLIFSIIPVVNTINFLNNNFATNIDIGPLTDVVGKSNTVQSYIDYYKDQKNRLLDYIIGCGKKHPSPLVRDYAKNVCAKCGLTFKSSIFDNPGSDYHNTCYHYAPVDKGVSKDDNTTFWIEANQPILTGIDFFEEIKSIVNGEWTIDGNVLTLERKDFFQTKTPWLDLTALQEDEFDICYNWSTKDRPSFGTFLYNKDAINSIGSEALKRWGEDSVEWNSPPLPGQKGNLAPIFKYAACRFRDDGVRLSDGPERDVLTWYENGAFIPAAISMRIRSYKNVVLLNQHLCYSPMLLIWDGKTSPSDARVSGTQFGQFTNNPKASPGQYYNYPFWFQKGFTGNLLDRFWEIENPRTLGFQAKQYVATIELTCTMIAAMDLDGMIKTSEGNGKITEIVLDYRANTMQIKGEI